MGATSSNEINHVFVNSKTIAFRIRQLEVLNHCITILSQSLWKDALIIDPKKNGQGFKNLLSKSMTYTNLNNIPPSPTIDSKGNHINLYSWDLLCNDTSDAEFSIFFKYKHYDFNQSTFVIKHDFDAFLKDFITKRTYILTLIQTLSSSE